MQISLAWPQFKDHYSTVLSFGLGYNLKMEFIFV